MAENKGKSGAGKFFLGALLGAAAGAIAGKFMSSNKDSGEELEECGCDHDGKCKCEDKYECKKEVAEKPAETKKTTKKEKE